MIKESFFLNLVNQSSWKIAGGNAYGWQLVAILAAAMGLYPVKKQHRIQVENSRRTGSHEFIIEGQAMPLRWKRLPQIRNGRVICSVGPAGNAEMSMVHLLNISQLLASFCEPSGGLLLHAALVCKGRSGFVLAGESGSGKTTASQRIPAPWRSCCDDYTLVVRDTGGKYWAHPWPTWSRFFQDGPGGSWPVLSPVRLRAIFFLQPGAADGWANPVKRQPIVKIMESVEQATWSTTASLDKVRRRSVRLRRLGNAIDLARSVPAFQLHLSLTGKFWESMENALTANGAGRIPDHALPQSDQ